MQARMAYNAAMAHAEDIGLGDCEEFKDLATDVIFNAKPLDELKQFLRSRSDRALTDRN